MIISAPPVRIPPALTHEIIYGAIEYAAQFGFRPHADFKWSRYVLDPPDRHARTGAIEFGHDGKPLYIQGPRDNVDVILRKLTQTAGTGNFDYLLAIPGSEMDKEGDQ